MKFAKILSVLAAAAALFVGCVQEMPGDLAELQVSSSFVSIPANGGSATITVKSSAAWSVAELDAKTAAWLTVSPMSGSAGETTVTFSAPETNTTKSAELKINVGEKTQFINVKQPVASTEVTNSSCAEVLAGADGKTYRIKGVVSAIEANVYGNYNVTDDTGTVYIYGTLDKNGAEKNFASWGIENGDIVTVEGPKSTYNGKVELVNVTVIEIEKSLIKVESVDPEDGSIPSTGGTVSVTVANKGNGLYVEVPEDAQNWLSIKSISGNTVTFLAQPNNDLPRAATLVFKTTDGTKDYTAETSISQNGSTGSLVGLPFTVAEAIECANKIGGESAVNYYVKGIVSKVVYTYSANYGTATFWISDDGTFVAAEDGKNTADKSHDFEAYSVYYFGNQPWVEGNAQIEVGAEVVLCGHITLYNGLAETASKKAWVHSINGVSNDAQGVGTLGNPFTAEGAIAAAQSAPKTSVYVKGIVSKILYNFSADYGTASFWISNDGKAYGVSDNAKSTTSPDKDFEAYGVYYKGYEQKWTESDPQIEVGQTVTLYAPLTVYNGVSETVNKKGYLYSAE